MALLKGQEEANYRAPAAWIPEEKAGLNQLPGHRLPRSPWETRNTSWEPPRSKPTGSILVAMPLPQKFSAAVKQLEASQSRYSTCIGSAGILRRTYMILLLLLTVLVLFATTWLALFLSKLVTRPVDALAEATEGNFPWTAGLPRRGQRPMRSAISCARSTAWRKNWKSSRRRLKLPARDLGEANIALEQRRRHIETILESIPNRRAFAGRGTAITHVNQALLSDVSAQGFAEGQIQD